ncbi:MAG: amidase [Phycisphaeraceae bacterium]|nr:amidase [Phycisphaeraceae bacterium]MCB9847798.1 amidase [Phycisphaeraceae bacterium]
MNSPKVPHTPPAPPYDRRRFLRIAGGAAAAGALAPNAFSHLQGETPTPEGVDLADILGGERLAGVEFTSDEREQIRRSIGDLLGVYDTLRAARLRNDEGPAEVFDPRLPGFAFRSQAAPARLLPPERPNLPNDDADIAYATIAELSHWIDTGQITSERLTTLYLDRLAKLNQQLECVVTPLRDAALDRARRADAEIAQGNRRGPLHGLPYGIKDLFDTAGVRTTWGAAPFKDRVPDADATVVRKLDKAGAVCIAKLTCGALAYGDIWFGGRTRNPWNTEQGSSGSSAGSASAVAAGCCAFTIGTETYGSIASPSARCGATGFRPTFGRVSRAGAMALCWSLDKAGPICRSAGDCAAVLDAVAGPDPADEATIDLPLAIDMSPRVRGMRIGYLKDEFESDAATGDDATTLEALRDLGCELVPRTLEPGPYGELIFFIISVEAAAAFDELTRFNLDDRMQWQDDNAWPNTFRTTRLAPAVEFMQARRLRRRFMKRAAALFEGVDAVIAPRRHGALHALTNMTGHPAITIRQGFREDGTPTAVTLWGGLFDDAGLLRLGGALERRLDLWNQRPPIG